MQQTREAAPRRLHLRRFLGFIVIVMAVIGVALYSFFHISPLDLFKTGFDGTYHQVRTTVEESNPKVTEILNDTAMTQASHGILSDLIIVGSVDMVKCFDSKGTQLWHVPVSLKKPLVQTHNGDVLVADMGGRYLGLIKDGTVIWDKTLDVDIVNAGLYDNWILVITKSNQAGYKRTIHAFSREGQVIAFRNVSDYYPFIAYHYPGYDHTAFIVCGVETQGLESASLFEFLDLSLSQRGSVRDSKDREDLFAGALPFSGERLLLYGQKDLICVDKALGNLWRVDLGQDFLTACGITSNDVTIAAVLNGEILGREKRQQTTLKMIDGRGNSSDGPVMDAKVTQIVTKGRTIACVAGFEVYFFNGSGEVLDVYTSRTEVEKVFLADEDLAYVVGSGKVVSVRVDVPKKFLGIF